MLFDVFDLDFDLMTLIHTLELDIMVTYWYTKNKANWSFVSRLWSRNTDRHTDGQTETQVDRCKTFTYLLFFGNFCDNKLYFKAIYIVKYFFVYIFLAVFSIQLNWME